MWSGLPAALGKFLVQQQCEGASGSLPPAGAAVIYLADNTTKTDRRALLGVWFARAPGPKPDPTLPLFPESWTTRFGNTKNPPPLIGSCSCPAPQREELPKCVSWYQLSKTPCSCLFLTSNMFLFLDSFCLLRLISTTTFTTPRQAQMGEDKVDWTTLSDSTSPGSLRA